MQTDKVTTPGLVANDRNERIKRTYFRRLRGPSGHCEATIRNIERSIGLYEEFTHFEDFGRFNQKKALEFKKWLENRRHRDSKVAVATQYQILRKVKVFFYWLREQPGFRTRILLDDIGYLNLDRKKVREATTYVGRQYPPLEHVINLCNSIAIKSEIDMRDRALIAFTLLSGMRDQAIVTLRLGCFSLDALTINQYPKLGVETKFGKSNLSHLFRFDESLLQYILDWVDFLKRTKSFSNKNPMFPRTKLVQSDGNLSFSAGGVEPIFWKGTGAIREIFKMRSAVAGLPYFPPHSFRHLAVFLAFKQCNTAEQIKAVSQNFGHEHVTTTLTVYGALDGYRVAEIIRELEFRGAKSGMSDEEIRRVANEVISKLGSKPS